MSFLATAPALMPRFDAASKMPAKIVAQPEIPVSAPRLSLPCVSDFNAVLWAREALAYAWNPNNHDYKGRCEKFGQLVVAVSTGAVTYADLGLTENDLNFMQSRFQGVIDNVYGLNT